MLPGRTLSWKKYPFPIVPFKWSLTETRFSYIRKSNLKPFLKLVQAGGNVMLISSVCGDSLQEVFLLFMSHVCLI